MFLLLSGVVEYDAEGFTKLTLLLMWKDFCFLVHSEYTFVVSMHLKHSKHVIISLRHSGFVYLFMKKMSLDQVTQPLE